MSAELEPLLGRLKEIIAKEALIDVKKLVPEATLETLGVASYDMVMVLMAIEEEFGVYLSVDEDMHDVTTFGGLMDLLADRITAHQKSVAELAGAEG